MVVEKHGADAEVSVQFLGRVFCRCGLRCIYKYTIRGSEG